MPSGDSKVEQVWHELNADLRRYIRRRVVGDAIADDLLQETFLRIHRSIETLEDSQRLRAWVYRLAANVVADFFRQQARREFASGDLQDNSVEADEENLNDEVADWLGRMVAELPETYRDAVRLSELEGVSQQQVAARLHLSLPAAKSRIQRGRQSLKQSLLACCHVDVDRRGNVVDYTPRGSNADCCSGDATCNEEPQSE